MNALKTSLLGIALASAWPAAAQEMDHSKMDHSKMSMPAPATEDETRPAEQKTSPGDEAATRIDHSKMDHAAMGHGMSGMPMDSTPGMQHDEAKAATDQPRTPIRPVTDADRAAAQPPDGHMQHLDNGIHSYTLLNRLEGWDADAGKGLAWEGQGWIGTDLDRVWWRSEGERVDGHTEAADLEVLYGRSVSAWWDVVAGVRHDFKPGAAQSFAAIGVQGLAPQKFEVAATAYVGERGQTAARFEVEYELLLTNRLILQPLVEADLYGRNDPARGIGAGLSTAEAGLRLRYEFSRRFAPYIGVVHERAFGNTADLRRAEGEAVEDTRFVVGLRAWF